MMTVDWQSGRAARRLLLVWGLLVATAVVAWPLDEDRDFWPAWVKGSTVNVRSGPSTDSKKIGQLNRGDKVHVTAFENKWCWAKLPDGSQGWVAEWLLEFSYDKGRQLTEQVAATSAAPDSHPPAWIKVDAANVRTGPGLGYQRYGSLPQGTKVYKLDQRDEWIKCRTPGGSGWIRRDLLEFDIEAGRQLANSRTSSGSGKSSAKAYVNGSNVRLRSGPGTTHQIIATLQKGQTVYVYDSQGDWKQVTVHSGKSGWIAGRLLTYEGATAAQPIPLPPAQPDFPSPQTTRSDQQGGDLYAWIDEPRVNVRSSPGQDNKVKFQLERGQKVKVVNVSGHWCQIETSNGQTGWIAGWVIDFSPPGTEFMRDEVEVKVGWVARSEVNLRSGPGLNYPEIGELTLSTQVIIIGQRGDWYRVALDNGKTGWAASWLIDTRAQRLARKGQLEGSPHLASASPQSRHGTGTAILSTAMRYLGAPYVRGAEGPHSFDCSGFVQYVLGRHGIHVTRTCPSQFRQGQPVSRSSLQAGDIVFFKNTYRRGISHVGIYKDNNQFIHAANSGSSVKISSLDSSYYAPRYIGARRMY